MNALRQKKEVTFTKTMEELTQAVEDLKSKREEYASLVNDSAESEINVLVTSEKYEVEYLWVKLGNYATKNGVTLKLNILKPTTGLEGMYDLEFILNGKYAGITEFIYEIENDSTLGFRIYDFSLEPTSVAQNQNNNTTNTTNANQTQTEQVVDTENLTATFTVKEVAIDLSEEQLTTNTETQTQGNENTTQQDGNTTTGNTVQQDGNTTTGNTVQQ